MFARAGVNRTMRDLLRNERWSLLMLASMFVLAAVNSPFLPDRLPSHWTGGQVDSYAAKSTVLMFWPLFASGMYAAGAVTFKACTRLGR